MDSNRFSDHYPIICHVEFQGVHEKSLFKFNHGCLKEQGFIDFVEYICSSFSDPALTPMELLTKKIILLKGEVINWERYRSTLEKRSYIH